MKKKKKGRRGVPVFTYIFESVARVVLYLADKKTTGDSIGAVSLTVPLGAHIYPVAPVAYQVILEPGIGFFCEFESPRVHIRINSWGLFLRAS